MQDENFINALRYINSNLESIKSVAEIAKAIGVSVQKTREMFILNTGHSIGKCIQRIKLDRAYKDTKTRDDDLLLIALQHGFHTHNEFSRIFKQYFGYSPSAPRDRRTMDIVNEFDSIELAEPLISLMSNIPLAVRTCNGNYLEGASQAWSQLYNICNNHVDSIELFFGIGHDGRNSNTSDIKFSAGIERILAASDQLMPFSIDAGYYAKFNFVGLMSNIGLAYHYIYEQWNQNRVDRSKVSFFMMDELPTDGNKQYELIICMPLIFT